MIDTNLFDSSFFPENKQTFQEGYNLSFSIPAYFLDQQRWQELYSAFSTVFATINQPAVDLALIRLPETQARIYKALHMQMMGYFVPDYLMNEKRYDSINQELGNYQRAQGRDSFVRFLGYALDADMRLYRQWTRDYESFSIGRGLSIYEGGDYYPTTHVGLGVRNLDQQPFSRTEIKELFYKHAPVELVLLWIADMKEGPLGELLAGITTYVSVDNTFRLEGRPDWNIRGRISKFAFMDIVVDSRACEEHISVIESSALNHAEIESSHEKPIQVTAINDQMTIMNNSSFIRNSPAWVFTDLGIGEFVGPNVIRRDHPATSLMLGILMEGDSINYIQSSNDITAIPWSIAGSYENIPVFDINPDSTKNVLTRALSGNVVVSQNVNIFSLTGKHCFSITLTGTASVKLWYIDRENEKRFIADVTDIHSEFPTRNSPAMWRRLFYVINFSTITANELAVEITTNNNGFSVFNVMLEPGTYPTSFIKTDDCGVTRRSADMIEIDKEIPYQLFMVMKPLRMQNEVIVATRSDPTNVRTNNGNLFVGNKPPIPYTNIFTVEHSLQEPAIIGSKGAHIRRLLIIEGSGPIDSNLLTLINN